MNRAETVIQLAKEGKKASEIAMEVGVSRQRVYQILSKPNKQSVIKKRPAKKRSFDDAKKVLGSRDSWTWVEAEEELSGKGIRVPGMKIYDLLRELGFTKKARNQSTWYRYLD